MKKIVFVLLALSLMLGISAFAGADKTTSEVKVSGWITDPMCAKSADKAMMENGDCARKCAEKDGKLAFVNMEDGKVWLIENSAAVKGHEGHQVSLDAHANADAGTLHVVKVSMVETKKQKKEEKEKKS